MCKKAMSLHGIRVWRAPWPHMSSVRRSRCGVSTGMMGTASPITSGPTKASGWSRKRWRSTPLSGVWCSMSSPKASSGSAIRGFLPNATTEYSSAYAAQFAFLIEKRTRSMWHVDFAIFTHLCSVEKAKRVRDSPPLANSCGRRKRPPL